MSINHKEKSGKMIGSITAGWSVYYYVKSPIDFKMEVRQDVSNDGQLLPCQLLPVLVESSMGWSQ